jgi:hypothetical protein
MFGGGNVEILSVSTSTIERMFGKESVVSDWATMVPGPALAASLASIDRSELNGHNLVLVLQAQARLIAHLQAEFMATMVDISCCPPGDVDSPPVRSGLLEEFAADEIRAALRLTRRAADSELAFGWELCEHLPRVWEALHSGDIDIRRGRVITNGVAHLPEDTARRVVNEIIVDAAGLTTGQLTARLQRLCIEVDPEDARHRYEEGLAERRVMSQANPDGTGDLYGISLPPHRVSAIRRKINRLARSLKSSDDPRSIDQIRADVFLDLLEGRTSDSKPGSGAKVDIQGDLKTLAGLSQEPGAIPGWGPVIDDVVRQIIDDQPTAQWRVAVADPDGGNHLWTGITRRRPNTNQQRLVETQLPVCVFPGCRMPSTDCDLDHTLAWTHGGPTKIENLAPLCRHDHRVKHEAGWLLNRSQPGVFTWTSPLGHTCTTTGRSP